MGFKSTIATSKQIKQHTNHEVKLVNNINKQLNKQAINKNKHTNLEGKLMNNP